jgi:dienelactone hydrolase
MPGQQLRSVSDTAFWMAQYRAIETDRPDAIFKDPLARLLAGDRGEQLVQQLTQGQGMTWPILRTVCFDELILALVKQGVAKDRLAACGVCQGSFMSLSCAAHCLLKSMTLPQAWQC